MSLSSVVDADYAVVINYVRGHISNGTRMNDYEMRYALAVVKDAVSRLSSVSTAIAAQMAILQAMGTNDASAEIDTADSTLTAAVSVPTYTSSTVADG